MASLLPIAVIILGGDVVGPLQGDQLMGPSCRLLAFFCFDSVLFSPQSPFPTAAVSLPASSPISFIIAEYCEVKFDSIRAKNKLSKSVDLGDEVKSCSGNKRSHELKQFIWMLRVENSQFPKLSDNFNAQVSILE